MSWDPLLCHTELDLEAEFYPLGFPFAVRSNSRLVLDAAGRSFGGFPRRFEAPRIEARLIVAEEGPKRIPPAPVFRAQRRLMAIVSDAANFAACDLANGFAFGCVTPAVAADADFLRFHFLEAIAYTLLIESCVTPVHASGVARNGSGVLLCGSSGAGKSSLAYACARRGWALVSDNACYLVDHAGGRLVAGRPQSLRFRPAAAELFPELGRFPAASPPDGKIILDLSAARTPAIATAYECRVGSLVFLARREGPARLLPVGREAAFERLASELPRYDDDVEQRHRQTLRSLVQAGVYELRYDNPEAATGQLERLIDSQ